MPLQKNYEDKQLARLEPGEVSYRLQIAVKASLVISCRTIKSNVSFDNKNTRLKQGRNQDFAKGGAELYTFQSKNSIAYWCICIIKRGTV